MYTCESWVKRIPRSTTVFSLKLKQNTTNSKLKPKPSQILSPPKQQQQQSTFTEGRPVYSLYVKKTAC